MNTALRIYPACRFIMMRATETLNAALTCRHK